MRTVPRQYGVTFASIDTTLVNMATVVMPLAGAALAGFLGIEFALRFGAFLSLCGVVLFAQEARRRGPMLPPPKASSAERSSPDVAPVPEVTPADGSGVRCSWRDLPSS